MTDVSIDMAANGFDASGIDKPTVRRDFIVLASADFLAKLARQSYSSGSTGQ